MSAKNHNIKSEIGTRLRSERDRVGLSQDELAVVGEVSKRTQAAWEKGEQAPNAEYLYLVVQVGIDVHYVLTGTYVWQVSGGHFEQVLSPDESQLLSNYRESDEVGRQTIRIVAAALKVQRTG